MTATVDVVIEDPRWETLDLDALATRAVDAALAEVGLTQPVEVALLAAADARLADLNETFRGRPTPTNVLSWPSQPLRPGDTPSEDRFGRAALGDIALAYETCAAEAAAKPCPLRDHVCHLIVHGLLHLLGHDHEIEEEAQIMEKLEVSALARLGLSTPY
ncbi:MAG: rRNA maturation RNase YbeY [Pseudomonadota bacterium]